MVLLCCLLLGGPRAVACVLRVSWRRLSVPCRQCASAGCGPTSRRAAVYSRTLPSLHWRWPAALTQKQQALWVNPFLYKKRQAPYVTVRPVSRWTNMCPLCAGHPCEQLWGRQPMTVRCPPALRWSRFASGVCWPNTGQPLLTMSQDLSPDDYEDTRITRSNCVTAMHFSLRNLDQLPKAEVRIVLKQSLSETNNTFSRRSEHKFKRLGTYPFMLGSDTLLYFI